QVIDIGAQADPALAAYAYAAAQARVRSHVHEVSKHAVVLDRAAGVQDDAAAHLCSGVDHGAREHHASGAQLGVAADDGCGMQHAGQRRARRLQSMLHAGSKMVVADAYDDAVVFVQPFEQKPDVAADGPRACAAACAGPGIVVELHAGPAGALGRVGNDAAMASGTHDGQSSHCSSPMNLRMVASPWALTPRRLRTRRTVMASIFRSSQKLRWSTYQTSSSKRSSQSTALRP